MLEMWYFLLQFKKYKTCIHILTLTLTFSVIICKIALFLQNCSNIFENTNKRILELSLRKEGNTLFIDALNTFYMSDIS